VWKNTSIWIFTTRRYASAVYVVIVCLSVRPSVRLSVTSRNCTKMAKRRITQTTPYDSPGTLQFYDAIDLGEIPTESPPRKAPVRDGVDVQTAIFDQYLAISQKRCKIGTWLLWNAIVGTRMCCIDWCYFRWPWVTLTTPNHPISTFYIAFHIFIVSGVRDFKFCR